MSIYESHCHWISKITTLLAHLGSSRFVDVVQLHTHHQSKGECALEDLEYVACEVCNKWLFCFQISCCPVARRKRVPERTLSYQRDMTSHSWGTVSQLIWMMLCRTTIAVCFHWEAPSAVKLLSWCYHVSFFRCCNHSSPIEVSKLLFTFSAQKLSFGLETTYQQKQSLPGPKIGAIGLMSQDNLASQFSPFQIPRLLLISASPRALCSVPLWPLPSSCMLLLLPPTPSAMPSFSTLSGQLLSKVRLEWVGGTSLHLVLSCASPWAAHRTIAEYHMRVSVVKPLLSLNNYHDILCSIAHTTSQRKYSSRTWHPKNLNQSLSSSGWPFRLPTITMQWQEGTKSLARNYYKKCGHELYRLSALCMIACLLYLLQEKPISESTVEQGHDKFFLQCGLWLE